MDAEFVEDDEDQLAKWCESDPGLVKGFRKVLQFIRAAADERDFYGMKSLHFEKLEGRGDQRSLRLTKKWRLIVELVGEAPNKRVRVFRIEDYH